MHRPVLAFVLVLLVLLPTPARAQAADQIGIRAQGMGGAFTAIADDSTATWWNPAGLASGAYFNAIVELTRPDAADAGGAHPLTGGFSLAYPALGLSYYRLRVSEIRGSSTTAAAGSDRQDQVALNQFGATVGQSLGDHVVVASTLKVVRGVGETHPGLDIGAMAKFGPARAGIMVRNAKVPQFDDDAPVALRRQVRVGAALSPDRGRVAVSVDADLTTIPTVGGDDRRLALGGELWTPGRSIGVRAGVSRSTVGEARTRVSGGASVAVRSGTYLDVVRVGGDDEARRGWGFDLRVTF